MKFECLKVIIGTIQMNGCSDWQIFVFVTKKMLIDKVSKSIRIF